MTLTRYMQNGIGSMVEHLEGPYYRATDLPPPTILEPLCEAYKEFSRMLALPENKQDEAVLPVSKVMEAAGLKMVSAVLNTMRDLINKTEVKL